MLNERRRAKGESKAERRKRKSQSEGAHVSRKYFIETYGCQMNYHDSEQMAGLLEPAGYDRTADDGDADVVVINTCSVREHAEDKLYTRLGELRVQARGDRPRSDGRGRPDASRSRKGSRSSSASAMVDVVVGTRRLRMLPMLVEQAARTRVAAGRPRPARQRLLPARRDAPRRSGARLGDDHRRLQRVLQLLRRARTRAATSGCGRRPRFWPRCATPPTRGPGRCSCSARSSTTTRRRTTPRATSPRCSKRSTTSTGIERIRFASPHPRHVTPRLIAAIRDLPQVCKHLHLPVQSGSTRVLDGDAAALHARGVSGAGRRAPRRRFPASRSART